LAIVFFGQIFENPESSPKSLATLSTLQVLYYFLINKGLGYILGDFFTSSSGHPVLHACYPI
jgi:hypothetical protein